MTDLVVDARAATERLARAVAQIEDAWENLVAAAVAAHDGRVWVALGYGSWSEYWAAEIGEPGRIPTRVRQAITAKLAEAGLSSRAIAPVIGADQKTVINDLSREEFSSPAPVVGLDGKTYPPRLNREPESVRAPHRRALTDAAQDAGFDLRKAVDRITRIREDDRYSRNRAELAVILRGQILYAIETCTHLLDEIDGKEN